MKQAAIATVLSGVLEELRRQHWTLTLNADGSAWRAEPPSRVHKVVKFPSSPRDVTSILRELRAQSFRWPSGLVDTLAPVPARIHAVPFPPKPHPEVGTEPQERGEVEVLEPLRTGIPEIDAEHALDIAFEELKDARDYAALAAEEFVKASKAWDEVDREKQRAGEALAEARQQLEAKKQAFARLFEVKT